MKARLEAALARCEGQIAALRQAVADTSDEQAKAAHLQLDVATLQEWAERQERAELHERLASLENRVMEQERTLRHTLTMLIEWIERDEAHSIAA